MPSALTLLAPLWLLPAAGGGDGVLYDSELGAGLPNPVGFAYDVEVADLDVDGSLDLFFVHEDGGRVDLGNGLGGFQTIFGAVPPSSNEAGVSDAGDVDGDGDPDVVVSRLLELQVLASTGAGHFTELAPVPVGGFYPPLEVRLADVDLDGDLDLLHADETVKASLADGLGGFAAAPLSLAPLQDVSDFYPKDYDFDGDTDFLVLSFQGASLLENDGSGSFAVAPVPHGGNGREAEFGDVDGDGDLDFVVADDEANVLVHLRQATGYVPVEILATPFSVGDVEDLELTDLDGDLDLDVVIAYFAVDAFACKNDGSGHFQVDLAALPDDSLFSAHMTFADLDEDGDEDVVGAGVSKELLLSDGLGGFFAHDPVDDVYVLDARGIVDVDGDGDLDLLSILDAIGLEDEWLFRNDGFGNMTPDPGPAPEVENFLSSYDVGDLDLDGDVDALAGCWGFSVLGPGPAPEAVLVNDGTGAFEVEPSLVVAPAGCTGDVQLVDADGDGDLDGLVANADELFPGDVDLLLRNDGTGSLVNVPGAFVPEAPAGLRIESGDFDADGDLDVLASQLDTFLAPSPVTARLYLGDGTGGFIEVTATHLPATSEIVRDVLVEDVDLDGDLDGYLLAANPTLTGAGAPQRDLLLRNDGTAHFLDGSADLPPTSFDPLVAAFVDVDLDGDPDLLRGCGGTFSGMPEPTELYRNDGAGVFTAAPEPVPPWQTLAGSAIGAADLDRDGDPDLVTNGRRFRSLWRELVAWSHATIGGTYVLELRSESPPAPFLLAYSPLVVQVDLGALGLLGLGEVHLLAAGLLDGSTTVSVPVPDEPAIVGTVVAVQALLDAPTHLSRVVLETISGL